MGSLIWFAQKVPTEGVKMGSIPVNEPTRSGGPYYLYLDRDKIDAALQDYGFKGSSTVKSEGAPQS